jgi:hypothetical protein
MTSIIFSHPVLFVLSHSTHVCCLNSMGCIASHSRHIVTPRATKSLITFIRFLLKHQIQWLATIGIQEIYEGEFNFRAWEPTEVT